LVVADQRRQAGLVLFLEISQPQAGVVAVLITLLVQVGVMGYLVVLVVAAALVTLLLAKEHRVHLGKVTQGAMQQQSLVVFTLAAAGVVQGPLD
jgi:hypothetical protein